MGELPMSSSVRLGALAALVACGSLWAAAATAQVYRIVGPDGRVTFSDRPPPEGQARPAASLAIRGGAEDGPAVRLPLELRNASSRYPVTLYTGADCSPCVSARNFLVTRGVPFTERTISTQEDVAALQRLAGATSLPFATIGGQHLRGFSGAEWAQYLDAAGYPKASQLPPNYRNPAPAPLVALQARPALPVEPRAAQPGEEPARAQAPLPAGPAPSNPAGIRF